MRKECSAGAFLCTGFTFVALLSSLAMQVAEVGLWAEAASRTLDWGVADADGITPLHMAACLEVRVWSCGGASLLGFKLKMHWVFVLNFCR